jgi:hypothetical protein|tara:strand:+ start:861 stop:1607 length:747 start_codon:yes stop_codon:yes gene_type:complete
MSNIKVSSDVDKMLQSADNAAIRSNIGAATGSTVDGLVTDVATNTDNINTNSNLISTNTTNIATNASNISINTDNINTNSNLIEDLAPKANPIFTGEAKIPKMVTGEIQCVGTTGGTAEPIHYDAKEHRFRDYDENPNNLVVIKKTDGENVGKVGINSNNPKSALHIVGGHSSGITGEAMRVIGGGFFDDWVRLGHYTDSTRDALPATPIGTIIYNSEHYEVQVFIGDTTGAGGAGSWKALTMQNVAT